MMDVSPIIFAHYGIFSSMLKNHRLCTGWLARLSAHHALDIEAQKLT